MKVLDTIEQCKILDSMNAFYASDQMFKSSLDITNFKETSKPVGTGAFGTYYSNFDQQLVKSTFGPMEDAGVKVFHEYEQGSAVSEWVSAMYFIPIIRKYTSIKTPNVPYHSMSNIMNWKSLFISRIDGITLEKALSKAWIKLLSPSNIELFKQIKNGVSSVVYEDLFYYIKNNWAELDFSEEVCENISSELRKAGLMWHDCHLQNVMIGKNNVQRFISNINNFILDKVNKHKDKFQDKGIDIRREIFSGVVPAINLLSQLYLVDFGNLYAIEGSAAFNLLIEAENKLKAQIKQRPNAHLSRYLDELKNLIIWRKPIDAE